MTKEQAIENVDAVFALYENFGDKDYIGEKVSQTEHMCQSAELAEDEGFDEEIILASFFHDIGHLYEFVSTNTAQMNGYGVVDHEKLGADLLREKGFSEKIAQLVQNHVQTKRYLTHKLPHYYNQLSEASKHTLEHQGGVMTAEEAEAFENDPLLELHIRIREWDDKAKVQYKTLQPISRYRQMAVDHLMKHNN